MLACLQPLDVHCFPLESENILNSTEPASVSGFVVHAAVAQWVRITWSLAASDPILGQHCDSSTGGAAVGTMPLSHQAPASPTTETTVNESRVGDHTTLGHRPQRCLCPEAQHEVPTQTELTVLEAPGSSPTWRHGRASHDCAWGQTGSHPSTTHATTSRAQIHCTSACTVYKARGRREHKQNRCRQAPHLLTQPRVGCTGNSPLC